MRLYFCGLTPLIDISVDGYQPSCRHCSKTPFNRVNHVLQDNVTYEDGVIYWSCTRCDQQNRYRLTNENIRTVNKPIDKPNGSILYAVIAKVAGNDDNIDYHAWRVNIYSPHNKHDQARGYSALNYKYMGYVNDSPFNDGQLEIVDGHNKRSTNNLKRSLAMLLNSQIGYYEYPCQGCSGTIEVNPSWKHANMNEQDGMYCGACHSRMME